MLTSLAFCFLFVALFIIMLSFFFIFFLYYLFLSFFFFFQAEDGILDYKVTRVQTCALPIWPQLLETDSARPARACRPSGSDRHAARRVSRRGPGRLRGASAHDWVVPPCGPRVERQ